MFTVMLTRTIAAHLRRGGLIAYPTESCYGLGCDPDNRVAVQKLLKLKQRLENAKNLPLFAHGQMVKSSGNWYFFECGFGVRSLDCAIINKTGSDTYTRKGYAVVVRG